ncbi:MAG TPA: HEAT repeat domain-containing protein [Bryobacteraceae bacterium]
MNCNVLGRGRWTGGVLLAATILAPLYAANEVELKDPAGATILKYVIEVPEGIAAAGVTDPAKQVGLILCSQEHDTPTGNDLFPVRQSLIRQGLIDQYVLVAPAPQGRKFGPADHAPIEKLIAWAKKTYPINPRRVYMYGKGEGSKISMEFTMTHPDLVTAAIGYSWGAWLMPSEVDGPIDYVNQAPEIYLTLGRRDLANHLSCVRDAYIRLAAKGYHFIYREFDELGDRTYHPPSNDDALGWATRLRNKNISPSAEEKKLLKAFGSAAPPAADGYYPTLAVVGGTEAGAVLQKLFESPDARVRAAAAKTCQHGVFGAAATGALAKLTRDSSPRVRRVAIEALAMYAGWRYPAAQNALAELALDKTADPADRVNAADAIGYAVRFQVKGFRQDPPMFRTLVALLQDKDEPVRSTAAGILAPVYEFGGDGPQRKRAPEGGWEKWLDSISTKRDLLPAASDPTAAFQQALKSAEEGSAAAQTTVGMMYADGKGVHQNYAEAARWWVKAAQQGDLDAARLAWNLYRNGEGVDRDPAMANQMAQLIGEPIQTPRSASAPPKK